MIELNVMTTLYDEMETMTDGTIEGNDYYGDPMDEEFVDNRTRIYIQNLNGINWDKSGGKWPYVCEMLTTIQADIACFTEVNTDVNNYTVRKKMETICQQHFQQNALIMSTSKYKSSTLYKPGGTAVLAMNSITARIKSHTRDRMGRWSSLCFNTSPNQKLRIIAAYQVCQNSQPGPNTAVAHQIAQIIEDSATTPVRSRQTPRESFIHDLQAFITQAQVAGEDVVLAGDFNEEMGKATSGMDRLATTCGLVDLFSIRTGSQRHPATYQRGTKRLDYILISPRLLPAVVAAGYDPFGYRVPSDHRGMYLDFSTETLFTQEHPQMAPITQRDFMTKSPETVRTKDYSHWIIPLCKIPSWQNPSTETSNVLLASQPKNALAANSRHGVLSLQRRGHTYTSTALRRPPEQRQLTIYQRYTIYNTSGHNYHNRFPLILKRYKVNTPQH